VVIIMFMPTQRRYSFDIAGTPTTMTGGGKPLSVHTLNWHPVSWIPAFSLQPNGPTEKDYGEAKLTGPGLVDINTHGSANISHRHPTTKKKPTSMTGSTG